jgi:tetratricopeptide (TPR) repeat protein
VATTLEIMAWLAAARGDFERAASLEGRALDIFVAANGPESAEVSWALCNLGGVLTQLGRYDEAIAMLERAMRLQEKILPTLDDDERAKLPENLADALLGAGRTAEARPLIERVVALSKLTPERRSYAQFLRAQLLWVDRTQRKRALQLAHEAVAATPKNSFEQLAEIRRWIASH